MAKFDVLFFGQHSLPVLFVDFQEGVRITELAVDGFGLCIVVKSDIDAGEKDLGLGIVFEVGAVVYQRDGPLIVFGGVGLVELSYVVI